MIKNLSLETNVLAGVMQHQDEWSQVSLIIKEDDFFSEDSQVNVTLFKMMRSALNNAEALDETILIERVTRSGMTFPDAIDISEYIRNLNFSKITKGVFESSIKELKKISVRRKAFDEGMRIQQFAKKVDPNLKYSEIVDGLDKIHNDTINSFESEEDSLVNLIDIAEDIVEDRGENPPEEVGYMGPHPTINKIYGSLLRPANILVFCARSKAGKTTVMLDYLLKTAYKYKVPVLHFDNGEMSEEELVFRMVACASGIPVHLLESGKWRTHGYQDLSAEQVVDKVREVWKNIKGIKILYKNVAGMTSEEMTSALKRIYFSEVGRGNELIFSFDYLKTDFSNLGKGSEWAYVGKTLHDFKQTISRELKFDGKPVVSMVTSVQANRSGINNARNGATDDESIVSLSDNITQFCSHLFILRKKSIEEIVDEGECFGTHKMIPTVARHLGEDPFAHLNPIETEEGPKDNFINISIENFNVKDRGDLRSIVKNREGSDLDAETNSNQELPEGF